MRRLRAKGRSALNRWGHQKPWTPPTEKGEEQCDMGPAKLRAYWDEVEAELRPLLELAQQQP